jgi:acyl-CoA thioesterase
MIISDIVTESIYIYIVYSIDRDKIIKYSVGLLRDERKR